jgi:hypothetical protein
MRMVPRRVIEQLYAPPGLAKKSGDLVFAAELGDELHPAWAADIDQPVVRGQSVLKKNSLQFNPLSPASQVP